MHPDVNDSPEATRRFQEVSDAYEAISTAERRRNYNPARGTSAGSSAGSSSGGFSDFGHFGHQAVDPEEVFKTVLHDMGVGTDVVKFYLQDLQDDVAEVSDAVKDGHYDPLWDFVNRRKGLFAATLLPLLVIFRMPGLALAALTVVPRIGLSILSVVSRLPIKVHIAALNALVRDPIARAASCASLVLCLAPRAWLPVFVS